jgi:hypothetical protein
MKREGWPTYAVCQRCMLEMTVHLDTVIAAKGGDFVLWGRTVQCRRRLCFGHMVFVTQPTRADGPILMS